METKEQMWNIIEVQEVTQYEQLSYSQNKERNPHQSSGTTGFYIYYELHQNSNFIFQELSSMLSAT